MKRTAAYLLIAALLTLSQGCGGPAATPASSPSPEPASAATSPPVPAATQREGDDLERDPKPAAPWQEPEKVDYAGKYLGVAKDSDASLYPAAKPGQTVETTWGALRLPEGWAVEDADGPQPVLVDGAGRAVGVLCQMDGYLTDPYYGLLNETDTPMTWEKPDYAMQARAMCVESAYPAVSREPQRTVARVVMLLTAGPSNDDEGSGRCSFACLIVDKAYVLEDGKIEYLVSNGTIDAMARSLAESLAGR